MIHSTKILIPLLAGTALLFTSCGKYEEREIETGYKGPARWNPFLAAERFLNEMGLPAQNQFGLGDLPQRSHTLVVPSSAIPAYGFTTQLHSWVYEGGHLVYFVDGGNRFLFEFGNDVDEKDEEKDDSEDKDESSDEDEKTTDSKIDPEDDPGEENAKEDDPSETRDDPILTRFEIKQRFSKDNPADVILRKETFEVDFPSTRLFIDPSVPSKSKNKLKRRRTPVYSTAFGDGRITVISHAHPFRNPNIGKLDHALLFWKIIQLQPGEAVHFVIAGRTSLWAMIWKYGWTAVIALTLLVALWLWKTLSRFGPLLAPEENGARDFFEHIDMTGKFLWRRGSTESLLEPLRQNTILNLQKKLHLSRTPGAEFQNPDLERIADHTGLPIETIRNALLKTNISDGAELTRIVRHLQQIQST
ncbi:MAG: DUF4350 domain-containing protein, partial [Verrucomicrobiota bacterium]